MKMHALKCPHCAAALEVEYGLDIFYCQYCGGKIMLEGLSKAAYRARVQVKEMDHREKLREKEIDQERYKLIFHSNEKRKEWLRAAIVVSSIMLLVVIIFLSAFISHRIKLNTLQELENQIEEEFIKGNYDSALFKANQLRCDDNWSWEETASWDAKREAYIEMIEAKIQENAANDPSNIFMPSDSNYFKGKNATVIQEQFSALGFTNIKLQPASEKANFFNKENTVEHILIGGKTDFTAEDYFDKDSPIIIYCYTK